MNGHIGIMRPCRDLNDLAQALAGIRRDRGMAQLALDQRIGWADGHCGKLEQPGAAWGRRALPVTFAEWLQGLGAAVFVVPDEDAADLALWLDERRRQDLKRAA